MPADRYAGADVDSHIEPHDLWTDRMAPRLGELIPRKEYPPSHPPALVTA